jgi:predicted nucleic acid-binding protein
LYASEHAVGEALRRAGHIMNGKISAQRIALKMLAQAIEKLTGQPVQAQIANELTNLMEVAERRGRSSDLYDVMIEEMQEIADSLGDVD